MNLNLLKYKLNAYSLVEVITALIMLLFLFFIAITFFVTINQAGFDVQRMTATNALEQYISTTDREQTYRTSKELINGWLVSREVQPYGNKRDLIKIEYMVYKKEAGLKPIFTRTLIRNTGTVEQ